MSETASPDPSRVADQVYALLKAYNAVPDLGWVFPHGTSFQCFPTDPSRVGVPDAAFISFARVPTAIYTEEGHCRSVPDIAVEVVAPDDRADTHFGKVVAWLDVGVRLVWEVYPRTRTVYVTRPDGSGLRLRAGDTLTAPDVRPGFAVPVADLFRLPGEPAAAPAAPVS